jgi:hypothetical protein
MPKQKTISMRDLAKHAERIAKDIEVSGTVYRIKRRGHRPFVMVDSEYIESLIATIEFMTAHPNWKAEMAESKKELAEGRYITLDQFQQKYGLDADGRPNAASRSPTRGHAGRRTSKGVRGNPRSRARAS